MTHGVLLQIEVATVRYEFISSLAGEADQPFEAGGSRKRSLLRRQSLRSAHSDGSVDSCKGIAPTQRDIMPCCSAIGQGSISQWTNSSGLIWIGGPERVCHQNPSEPSD